LCVGDDSITLTHVLNYPKSFFGTEFWFYITNLFEPLTVQVKYGNHWKKLFGSHNQIITTDIKKKKELAGMVVMILEMSKGVYIYKLTVKSNLQNKKTGKIEKLIIL
jgi:hypothetical protein